MFINAWMPYVTFGAAYGILAAKRFLDSGWRGSGLLRTKKVTL